MLMLAQIMMCNRMFCRMPHLQNNVGCDLLFIHICLLLLCL